MPPIIISPGTVVDSAGIGAIAPLGAKYFASSGIIHCVGDPVSGHSSGATLTQQTLSLQDRQR